MNLSCSAFARCAAVALVAVLGAALPQAALAQGKGLAGTWNLVPEKSTYPGPARYKSLKLSFTEGAQAAMSVEGLDASGKPVTANVSILADGKPHPVTGMPTYDAATWTRYSDTNSSFSYLKGRTVVALGTRVLSADGKTLTFRENLFDRNGKPAGTAIMVFDNPDVQIASIAPPPPPPPPPIEEPVVPPPPMPDPNEAIGTTAMAKGETDAAIAAFTLVIDKKDPGANLLYDYVMRGVAFAKKDQYEMAIADFDAALELKPDNVDARFRRGGARLQARDYMGAVDDLSAVIQADANHALAYWMRGRSYFLLDMGMNSDADSAKACSLNKDLCPQ